jgi:general secretion pathway protein A
MYCKHYGFSEKPFDVTSNPRFIFLIPGHRETLASIEYGVRERRGFITLIGEVGTGKTTLLNAAMDRMDKKTRAAFIFTTKVTFGEMLNMALYEWGLIKINETVSKVDAIRRLNRFAIEQLKNGGNVVLIVDEAQNLDNSVLEDLRLLSNLETRRHKLIQVILSGQPELDTKLNRNELRQFAQRISIRRYIFPLDEKDTYSYLRHRLKLVKDTGTVPFTPQAQKLIWEYSKGIPRKINILCDNVFLIGYALKTKKINEAMILEAARDLKWHPSSDTKAPRNNSSPGNAGFTWVRSKPPKHSLKLTVIMIIVGILIVAGSYFLISQDFKLAKLTGYIGNIKNTTLETVHSEQTKEKTQGSPSDIFVNTVTEPKIKFRKVPKEKSKPGTQEMNTKISYMTPYKYDSVKGKSPELIPQNSEIQNTKTVRTFDEADPSEIRVKDKKRQYLFASETRADDKEKSRATEAAVKEGKIIRQIMIKKGDTLHKIITQTYGTYDDIILSQIQRQNPEIIDPDLILAGQVIKMPED